MAWHPISRPVDLTGLGIRREQLPAGFGLVWLLRLRWLSLTGQIVVCLIASFWLRIQLPVPVMTICIIFTGLSNVVLWWCRTSAEKQENRVIPLLVAADIVVLTAMLYFAGGAHNPFSTLYLLHITIAAILLPVWAAWGAVGFCGLGFSLLFLSNHVLLDKDGIRCCDDLDFHLQGMWVAMVITGAGVAYFVTRLRADLQKHRERLAGAKAMEERQERFAGLATLAAGVAHELATPLGTIAVVSKDMEKQACNVCGSGGCQSDARLIREEVERCRNILEKLGERGLAAGRPDYESLSLDALPDKLLSYLPAKVTERIRWEWKTPGNSPMRLPVDSLLRVLAVLVKNACEASDESRPVGVSLELNQGHECLFITVTDEGSGMDAAFLEKLGEPFLTTKEPGAGMGLGFFLVRTLMENLGGRVSVSSKPGEGTTVQLEMPLG